MATKIPECIRIYYQINPQLMLQATIFASCDDNSELMHFPQNYVGRRLDVLYMSAKKGWIIFHYIEMFFERYTALLFDYGF